MDLAIPNYLLLSDLALGYGRSNYSKRLPGKIVGLKRGEWRVLRVLVTNPEVSYSSSTV